MFRAVFILHILQTGLLVLGSIRGIVFRINIHSLVPLPKRSQLPERIKDMCRNEEHTSLWSHFHIVFRQLLPRTLHSKESIFLPLCLFLGQSSDHAVHVIKRVIVDSDDVTQSNGMPFRHPEGPVPEWPLNLHDILDNSPLILCCEERPVVAKFWVFKPLPGEFTQSVGVLEQLQCRVPTCLHIHNG